LDEATPLDIDIRLEVASGVATVTSVLQKVAEYCERGRKDGAKATVKLHHFEGVIVKEEAGNASEVPETSVVGRVDSMTVAEKGPSEEEGLCESDVRAEVEFRQAGGISIESVTEEILVIVGVVFETSGTVVMKAVMLRAVWIGSGAKDSIVAEELWRLEMLRS
jgi:hypothetical protein